MSNKILTIVGQQQLSTLIKANPGLRNIRKIDQFVMQNPQVVAASCNCKTKIETSQQKFVDLLLAMDASDWNALKQVLSYDQACYYVRNAVTNNYEKKCF